MRRSCRLLSSAKHRSRSAKQHLARDVRLTIETLEPRQMLDATAIISEFMADNEDTLLTQVRADSGEPFSAAPISPDWIEIRNLGSEAMDLGGFHLTDNENDLEKWEFPAGTNLPADGYLVVFASGLDLVDPALDKLGRLHTNFKLTSGGEYLALTQADETIEHDFWPEFSRQSVGVSFGITANGSPTYFDNPTPGAVNDDSSAIAGFVADTNFSVDRGFFDEPFATMITSNTPGATIVYTLDGSAPTLSNGVPVAAINESTTPSARVSISTTTTLRAAAFKSGFRPTNIDTQTYIFAADVLQQDGADIDNQAVNWGHAGKDWEVDPEIVNHADPESRLVADDLLSISTVSLVMNFDEMWGRGGIYISGESVEKATSVELINPDGEVGFQIDASVQIVGGSSTSRWKSDKLSMRLKFNEEFGSGDLNYSVFGDEGTDSFDTLVLDARLNNVWSYGGGSSPTSQRNSAQYLRDQFTADLENATGALAPHGRYIHLYINGIYWGMHTLHERPDDNFAAAYLGGDNEDYDVIKHGSGNVVQGTNRNYQTLFSLASQNLSDPANYQAVLDVLDVDDFINYMLVNFYVGNTDWAHHNWYASYNKVDPNGRWRFHSWDAEKGMQGTNDNVTGKNDSGGPTALHQRLASSAEYRLRFADRVHELFFNDGVLTPQVATELYQLRLDEIDRAVVAESARWGDNQRSTPYTRGVEWIKERDRLLNSYFPGRTNTVFNQLDARNLYSDTDAPEFEIDGAAQHGGLVVLNAALEIDNSNSTGTIYYTLDGTDPRQYDSATGNVSLSDGTIAFDPNNPISITEQTTIRSRILLSGEWSALSEATYAIDQSGLQISEVHYNPAVADLEAGELDVDNDLFEFIELTNISDTTLGLKGAQFADGTSFDFSTASVNSLGPGEFALVVRDQAAFESRYGTDLPVIGEFTNGTALNNAGESVQLIGALGETLSEFEYNDNWFDVTDGGGYSLTVRDPSDSGTDLSDENEWRPSNLSGGSPGTTYIATTPGAVVIHELLASDNSSGWLELFNTTNSAVDIGHWYLSDTLDNLRQHQFTSGTIVPANGFLLIDEAALVGFGLSHLGGQLFLSGGDAQNRLLGYREDQSYTGSESGIGLGIYPKSNGATDFVRMISTTPGDVNSGPIIGPLVINEIMYHPPAGEVEFIELKNTSDVPLPLDNSQGASWRVRGAIDFVFPAGVVVPAGGYALLVQGSTGDDLVDQGTFRAKHNLDDTVPIVIYSPSQDGSLSNNGEKLFIEQPVEPNVFVVIDAVKYDDDSPWSQNADGLGFSLSRVGATAYGNDVANWSSSQIGGTPGAENSFFDDTPPSVPDLANIVVLAGPQIQINWTAAVDSQSGVARYIVYRDSKMIGTTTELHFVDSDVKVNEDYSYQVSAVNGSDVESERSAAQSFQIFGILSADPVSGNQLRVSFSDVVNSSTAENVANYTIAGGAIQVTDAQLQSGGTDVLLTTAQPLIDGQPYRLVAQAIDALDGGTLIPDANVIFVPGVSSGGISGEYFNNTDLSGEPVLTRVDSSINFNWGSGSPDAAINSDNFSARWSGNITPKFNEVTTFRLNVDRDGGVRLWVNEQLVVDGWTSSANRGTFDFTGFAGKKVPFRMEYFDATGTAKMQLAWGSTSQRVELIPSSAFSTAIDTEKDAPAATAALVSNRQWSPEFIAALDTAGLGSGSINLPAGVDPITWPIDQISITFDEDMNVEADDLIIPGHTIASVDYDFNTFTATWTLDEPATAENLQIELAGGLTDLAGNAVEGDSNVGSVRVLVGDVDRSGLVDNEDIRDVMRHQFNSAGQPRYSITHDLNSDGAVNFLDLIYARDARGGVIAVASPLAVMDVQPGQLVTDAAITLDTFSENTGNRKTGNSETSTASRLFNSSVDSALEELSRESDAANDENINKGARRLNRSLRSRSRWAAVRQFARLAVDEGELV